MAIKVFWGAAAVIASSERVKLDNSFVMLKQTRVNTMREQFCSVPGQSSKSNGDPSTEHSYPAFYREPFSLALFSVLLSYFGSLLVNVIKIFGYF